MVVEAAEHGRALQFVEFGQLLVGAGRAAAVGDVHARQRADAIHAIGIALGLVVRRLQVSPGFVLLPDVLEIIGGIEPVRDDVASGINDSNATVVESEATVFLDDAQEERGKSAKAGDFFAEAFGDAFKPLQRALGDREHLGDTGEDGVAVQLGQRLAHSPRHDPRGMNSLSAQPLDDLLAELAQANAVAGQFGLFLEYAEDVGARRIGVHAKQQVGRREIERNSGHAIGRPAPDRRCDAACRQWAEYALPATHRRLSPRPSDGLPDRCRRCAPSGRASRRRGGLRRISRIRGIASRGNGRLRRAPDRRDAG